MDINLMAGAFVTGSGANLLGTSLIGGEISGKFFFVAWIMAMFPFMPTMMFVEYIVSIKNNAFKDFCADHNRCVYRFGFSVISLDRTVAFMIEHVYVLQFNNKRSALMYETVLFKLAETFKFGITMMVIARVLNTVA